MKTDRKMRAKKAEIRQKNYTALIAIITILVFVFGVEGCVQSTASKTGIDFTLVPSLETLSSGKTIEQGSSFGIHIQVENYDKTPRSGEICVRDDMDDVYEGVASECVPFNVDAAEISEEKSSFGLSSEKIQPGVQDIYLPSSNDYKYKGLPADQSAKLYVSLSYVQSSRIESPSGIKVPEPQTEIVQLNQEATPIIASVEKSIVKKDSDYKVSLGINLINQQNAKIYTSDFKTEDVIALKAEMPPKTLECEDDTAKDLKLKGLVEVKNKKFIKCSTLVDAGEQTTWPFVLTMGYGVKIEKSFAFTIKVK